MKEAEGLLFLFTEAVPVGTRGLQEGERSDDVGLDELGGTVNGSIDMRLGGKVHDGPGAMLRQELGN